MLDDKSMMVTSDVVTSQEVRTVKQITSHEVMSKEIRVVSSRSPEMTSRWISPETLSTETHDDEESTSSSSFEDDCFSGGTFDSKGTGEKSSDGSVCDRDEFLLDINDHEREAPLAEGESPFDDEGESPSDCERESPLDYRRGSPLDDGGKSLPMTDDDSCSERGEAEGRSRSVSPRYKESAVKSSAVPDVVLPTTKFEVEVGQLCLVVFFFSCKIHSHDAGTFCQLDSATVEFPNYVNPFTPKSDQFQISPAASPGVLHHKV